MDERPEVGLSIVTKEIKTKWVMKFKFNGITHVDDAVLSMRVK